MLYCSHLWFLHLEQHPERAVGHGAGTAPGRTPPTAFVGQHHQHEVLLAAPEGDDGVVGVPGLHLHRGGVQDADAVLGDGEEQVGDRALVVSHLKKNDLGKQN